MSYLVFFLSLALVLGTFLAERELTRHPGDYPWINRVTYGVRPFLIGAVALVFGLIVWACPPHCDAIVGAGGIAILLGSWIAETRKKPVISGDKNESLLRLAHPLGR